MVGGGGKGPPLHQLPPHAPVSVTISVTMTGRDADFRHYTNAMTQFADTLDRANSMASSTSDLRDSDVIENNPVVPEPGRYQIDLD